MNYLKKNLNNSNKLPYDVMKLISEYAEPLFLKQIENKDYDFDKIMANRMRRLITSFSYGEDYFLQDYDGNLIVINQNNININELDYWLINSPIGYKKLYLSKSNEQNICGLSPYRTYQIATMLTHIDNDKSIKKPKRYTLKNIYKIWLKL